MKEKGEEGGVTFPVLNHEVEGGGADEEECDQGVDGKGVLSRAGGELSTTGCAGDTAFLDSREDTAGRGRCPTGGVYPGVGVEGAGLELCGSGRAAEEGGKDSGCGRHCVAGKRGIDADGRTGGTVM